MSRRPLDLEESKSSRIETEVDPNLEPDSSLEASEESSLDEIEDSSEELSASEDESESLEEGTPEEKEDEENTDKIEASEEINDDEIPPGPAPDPIDLGGGKMLKPEDFKDPKLFDVIKRGYLREADYTRKLQQHSKTVDGAAQIWNSYKAIQNDPCPPLLNWFQPQQLLSALAKHGYDVDPSLLNGAQGNAQPQADPRIINRLNYLEQQNNEYEQSRLTNEISTSINSALSDIKSPALQTYIRNRTLAALYQNPHADVRELTLKTREEVRRERATFIRTKKEQVNGRRVGKTSGGSVPVMKHQGPQTWDDANESARRRLGG